MRWTSLPFIVAVACNPTRAPQPTTASPPPSEPAPIDVDAIVAQSQLPDTLDTPLPDDPLRVTIHRLSNGLTVYLSPMPEAGRVSATVVVRVGAADDPEDAPGLTHLLEHMLEHQGTDELGTVDRAAELPHLEALEELYRAMSDGTEARGPLASKIGKHERAVAATSIPGEIATLYRTLGFIRTRVDTSHDDMRFSTQLPRDRLAQWAEVEAERFADPVFRLLYPELPVMFDELNRRLDNGRALGKDAARVALFAGHPLSKPLLGTPEHLRAPDYDAMVEHYERWFVPNNMALVLVGDVDETVLPTLEQAFSRLRPANLPKRDAKPVEGVRGRHPLEIRAVHGGERVELTWKTVAPRHPDALALRVLGAMLGSSSRGHLEAVLGLTGLVDQPRAHVRPTRDSGTILIDGQVGDGSHHSGVEQRLLDVVAALPDDLTEAQLQSAKLHLRIASARGRESLANRANKLVAAFSRQQDWASIVAEPARIEALTLAQVSTVAQRWLGDDFVALWGYQRPVKPEPLEPPPDMGAVRHSEAAESPRARAIRIASPEVNRPDFMDIGRGVSAIDAPWGTLLATSNETDDLFELRLYLDRGSRREPLMCHALWLWQQSGGDGRSAAELQAELRALGSAMWSRCSASRSTIVIDGIDEHFEATVALVSQWLAKPEIEERTWTRYVENEVLRRGYRVRAVDPVSTALMLWARFGSDSARLTEPSTASLRATPVDQMARVLSGIGRFQRTATYYGPRDLESVVEITAAFGPGREVPEAPMFYGHRRRSRAGDPRRTRPWHARSRRHQLSGAAPVPGRSPRRVDRPTRHSTACIDGDRARGTSGAVDWNVGDRRRPDE